MMRSIACFPAWKQIKEVAFIREASTHGEAGKAWIDSVVISQSAGFKEKLEPIIINVINLDHISSPAMRAPFAFYYAWQRA